MKKLLSIAAMLLVCVVSVMAQSRTVTGRVTSSEDGEPVIGASVVIPGTTTGTVTDAQGNFTLRVPEGTKHVQVSYIGMATQRVAVKQNMLVVLESDSEIIDEVIVMGYGTQRREAKTGSVTTVQAKDIVDVPAISVDKMLAGRTAGVQITAASGQPGASSQIRIRGISSIKADNEPLWVVDGIPVMNGDQSYFTNTSSAIATLSPDDIESITILKDAAAASVYGSRAANGVILVTTKSGKEGKSHFGVRAKFGVSQLANDNDFGVMSASELLSYQRQAIINAGRNPDDPTGGSTYYRPMSLLAQPLTNWMKHLTRNGHSQEYEATLSGGSAKTKYYSSANYNQTDGIVYGNDYKRISFRVNADHEVSKWIKTGARVTAAYQASNDIPMQSLYYANPLFAGMTIMPWTPAYNEDGSHFTQITTNANTNPRANAQYDDQWEKQYRFNGSMYLEWSPVKGLTLKSTNAAEMTFGRGRRFWSLEAHDYESGYPVLQTSDTYRQLLTTSNTATYQNTWDKKHALRVVLGQEASQYRYDSDYMMSEGLNPQIPYHATANTSTYTITDDISKYTILSFLGIADYSYDSRYYLQLSAREDGCSKFGDNEKWGLFYAIGASWNAHNETFLKDVEWLNTAKLRASYGVNGNNNIANYTQYGTYSSYVYNGVTGMVPSNPANDDLTWELNKAWNVGLDFGFFSGRLTGSFDWYTRKTEDMLLNKSLSFTTGFASALMNVGSLRNEGFEIQLDGNIYENKDWHISAGFNLSHNKSKVLDLAGDESMAYSEDSRLRHAVGHRLFEFYVRDYYGVNPVDGSALWVTEDGSLSGDFNDARYIYAGSPEPKLTGGVHLDVEWKGLALSAVGEFKTGNKVFIIENRYFQSDGNQMSMNQVKSALNYWKQEGDTGCNPKPIAGNTSNSYSFGTDRYIEKGDYFRIKDVTLSYTFPSKWTKKCFLSSAKVYVSAYNLYTFHDVNFWDPERGVDGMGYGIYPQTKTFLAGIDLNF